MISLFFIGFLLLTTLWNLYYALRWNKDLSVTLHFMQGFVYAGDSTELTEQIENRKKMMLPVLEVSFHMDRSLSFRDSENTNVSDFVYKRDIFALLGSQRITRRLTLDCRKRGYYRIGEAYLTAYSMLHRRRFSMAYPSEAALYVYAARTDVSDILSVCERLMGSLQCAKRLYEDPFAFASIREYTLTDPMNTINWKASARTGGLMVNTFESTVTQKVMIYLDVEDRGILKYEYLTEESLCVAASLAQKLIGRGMEVGLCANISPKDTAPVSGSVEASDPKKPAAETSSEKETPEITYIEPAGGSKQLADIEQILAQHKTEDATVPFEKILAMSSDYPRTRRTPLRPDPARGPDGIDHSAFMIFISKNVQPSQDVIGKFVGREQPAMWVVPYPGGASCEVRVPDNIRVLRREVSDC